NRHIRRRRVYGRQSGQSLAVGKIEVQQEYVDAAIGQPFETGGKTTHPLHAIAWIQGPPQGLAHQARVSRVVLDQQYVDVPAHSFGGSFTRASQKSSMDFTTFMNCFRSTGLVT